MSALTVFSVVRNGVRNGYPFVEAYGSWLDRCDRLVVVDGESTDGTDRVLEALAAVDPRVVLASRPWPADDRGGHAIARLTETALELAADGAERLMYVQADEIYTEQQRGLVESWEQGALEFESCVNFWNGWERVLENEFPMRYLRLFPAGADVRSLGDGFTFQVDGAETTTVSERFLHCGWCFPRNVLQKHVSHAEIYRESRSYRLRGALAQRLLDRGAADLRLLDALEPEYRPVPYGGEYPSAVRHLLGRDVYDPWVGIELLRSGMRW
jgi:hypothetical protein